MTKPNIYIKHTVDGVTQMQQLLVDLLKYARVTSNTYELIEVDLNTLVKNVLHDLEYLIAESHAEFDIDKLLTLSGDVSLLRQLFQNLISNAIKFRTEESGLHIEIRVKEKTDHWYFSISDDGIGIEKQYLDKILVMFQRLHYQTQYSGSGVGLAICKKVVLAHGGRLWAEPVPGTGTTFFFTIPKNEIFK